MLLTYLLLVDHLRRAVSTAVYCAQPGVEWSVGKLLVARRVSSEQ